MIEITRLKFDENGLIPAVIVDFYTKKVLTLAYMNAESLKITIDEGRTCFYSRSRGKLWRKGETSGNFQRVVSIKTDCDRDALTVEVIRNGPACHLGTDACFNDFVWLSAKEREEFSFDTLYGLIQDRKLNGKDGSYTSYLFEQGTDKILKKVGEECTEVIIAGKGGDRAETIFEIADLAYHLSVLMVNMDISCSDILGELSKRRVVDKKVKQRKMQ